MKAPVTKDAFTRTVRPAVLTAASLANGERRPRRTTSRNLAVKRIHRYPNVRRVVANWQPSEIRGRRERCLDGRAGRQLEEIGCVERPRVGNCAGHILQFPPIPLEQDFVVAVCQVLTAAVSDVDEPQGVLRRVPKNEGESRLRSCPECRGHHSDARVNVAACW